MTSDRSNGRVRKEASRWFARLNQTAVRTDDLLAFRTWRSDAGNADAYEAIEALWRKGDELSQDAQIRNAVATAHSRSTAIQRRVGRLTMALGGAAAGGAAVALVGLGLAFGPGLLGWTSYASAVGEQRTVALRDGSQVRLDTNSRIEVRLTAHARQVVLAKGQAFFAVRHDASLPFTVRAGRALIRDLGTRFDVRRQGDSVAVTLVEGALTVSGSGVHQPAWRLAVGQQAIVGAARPVAPHAVDVSRTTSWTTGWLVFDNLPLAAAADEVNRYGGHRVVIDAGDLGSIAVSGSFRATDADSFAAAVAKLYGLGEAQRADGAILLTRSTRDRAI